MQRLGTARARIVLLATVGVLVTALTACAQPTTADPGGYPLGGGRATDSIGDYPGGLGADCETGGGPDITPPQLPPLPADAVLVSARRCVFLAEVVPGDGEWLMRVEQQATSGLEALAVALRLPSEATVAGQACPGIGYIPIVITVTDSAGRQIHPAVPQTACGAPLKATTDAIAALPWTTVATTRARQSRSELEVSSGCSNGWKPMIPLIAAEGSGTQTATLDTTARPMRVCRYDLDPDPANAISLNNGTPYRSGILVSASILDGAAVARLLTALSAAPRAVGACAQPEHAFAVIYPVGGGAPWIAIELGGCYRAVLDSENYLRQLDAATVAPLLG
jgi:hypothetical protein